MKNISSTESIEQWELFMGNRIGQFYGKDGWVILREAGMGKNLGSLYFADFLPALSFMGTENDFESHPPPLRLIIENHTFLKHFCTHRRKNCIVNSRKSLQIVLNGAKPF